MVSSAFKSAYVNQVNQQNQGINTISSGVKDLATVVVGALGFSGALGSGTMANAAKFGLANKIGGVGGALMVATMNEKADKKEEEGTPVTQENVMGALGDNPINNTARKQLTTVFEQLNIAKEKNLMTKEGKIASPMGDVDPNSNLGKKILEQLKEEDK